MDEYGRRLHSPHSRPVYAPGYSGGAYEYTGQPVGFEHIGSPPKQRLEDMDAKTIAQLGYEGPEGERRKVEAINEVMYENRLEREGYLNGVPIEGYRRREGYSDGHDRDRHHSRHGSSHSPHSSSHRAHSSHSPHYGGRRDEEEYRRYGDRERYDPRYARPPPVIPVTVERKFEEDGTVVENVYPDNTVAAALYSPRDPAKIHYGRQESFPEQVLQEAVDSAYRHGHVPGRYAPRYPNDRGPPPVGYSAPYSDATSSYARRPHDTSQDFVDDKYRRY